ncbi:MAG: putative molybdenum carrier protein [Saprospiraceae bacterium]|nr:putative molybdenum carrier protein [Saprospiraceae bacterium]
MIKSITKIISGAQTGVDLAALDFAIQNDIPCGGWCPKGRINESGIIPEKYPLAETKTSDYSERTEMNIKDSDGTLVLFSVNIDEGTKYTLKRAMELQKPFYSIDISSEPEIDSLMQWIRIYNIKTLNIAGARESNYPGIYKRAYKFLEKLQKNA